MCKVGILVSDYSKAPNDLLIKLEGCGFLRLVTSRDEDILHSLLIPCTLCCISVRFDTLCCVKKQCNNNMPNTKTSFRIKLPFFVGGGNNGSFVFHKNIMILLHRKGGCLLCVHKTNADRRHTTSLQFNIACHIVKCEILSEAETQKASLNSYVSQVSADVPGG